MNTLFAKIKDLFGLETTHALSSEELQSLFKSRYQLFRELLTANNNALEAMAEMEKALLDGRTFSMMFIRTKATVVTVNLYKIIHNLLAMSDGRYPNLEPSFNRIREEIDTIIDRQLLPREGELILPLSRINRTLADMTGEKMANLGEVGSLASIRIPPGFAITSAATHNFFVFNELYPAINRHFQQMDTTDLEDLERVSAAIRNMVEDSPLPPELEAQILKHFDWLDTEAGPNLRVAMRSSALGEDLGRASFAGLYHTELDVDRAGVVAAYKRVIASKYSTRAISYRLEKGYRHEEIMMCVGCLAMIAADLSGVCYTRSLGGRTEALDIHCASGSAKGIVEGTRNTVHLLVNRRPPHQVIGQHPTEADQLLTAAQVTDLCRAALTLERHFDSPQDIEWSIDLEGRLTILQSRPITAPRFHEETPVAPLGDDSRELLLHGGVTGCRGVGCGPVAIVRTSEDLIAFPRDAVLVVEHPLPEWAPLLQRATAMISETGSEAGHLATISREFGLPSLLAIQGACQTLVPGEEVTVDATNHAVYRGQVPEVLARRNRKRTNPMDGSPVQQVMIEVLKLISPLHLTDPASPYFRALHCRTMHDLTRFCHEKAVIEMFDFGRRYRFDRGAAKRLVDNMPLEWWVINLADGFAPEFDPHERYINISQIVCEPMLAIWQGMHAIPWAGPPQVSMRGMGSIFFQSTMNPSLDPAVPSAMTQKNYFLISRNFCNLSVRLGYHYAMVEAFISSLRTERYVTFRFKGGAADESRRIGRINLLAEVLAAFDFRIEQKGDALTARVEKQEQQFLRERLQVLGYLITHSRQIDMVMANEQQVRAYRDKFITDCQGMLHGPEEDD